jgi:hypothetical protein
MGPIIDYLLPRTDPCEWCGIIGDVSVKHHTLRLTSIDGRRPARRWEHKCQTCKRQLDAQTGKLKEKTKSRNQVAIEQHEKTNKASKYWWNEGFSDTKKT